MKTIKLFALLLVVTSSFAQISDIRLKSKVQLLVDTRTQAKDTVYVTIDKWIYDSKTSRYVASVVDYTKNADGTYKEINKKVKIYTKEEVNGLFTYLNNPITIGENYSNEMDSILIQGLYIDTVSNLLPDGKTIYGGSPADWEVDN